MVELLFKLYLQFQKLVRPFIAPSLDTRIGEVLIKTTDSIFHKTLAFDSICNLCPEKGKSQSLGPYLGNALSYILIPGRQLLSFLPGAKLMIQDRMTVPNGEF